MNTLVFVTYNIEPEHWFAFANIAAVRVPSSPPIFPYILVSSASASADYFASTPRTERLTETVRTELASFTRADLQRLFKALVDRDENNTVERLFFVVLDAESAQGEGDSNKKALVVERSLEVLNEQGEADPELMPGDEGTTSTHLWRWHRLPFDQVCDNLAVMSTKGRMWDEDASPEEEIWDD